MDKNSSLQSILPPKKEPFWSRFFGKEKTAFKILGFLILLWVAFDTGRVVSNILLLPLAQKTDGSITISEMMTKIHAHPGGRLILLDVGARYQDTAGKTWFVEDLREDIRPIDYEAIVKNNVVVDGTLGFKYAPSSTTRTNMVASAITGIAFNLVFLAVYAVFGWFIFKTVRGSGSRRFTVVDRKNVKTRFADVAGHKHAKQEIMEVVDFINNPAKYKKLGAKAPRGVILYGDPGNGKTLLAKAIAGESGANFIEQSASSFVDKFVGEGASAVRSLFKEARKLAPCVVFIDELDSVGGDRSSGHEERIQTLNQLFIEMDGFSPTEKIIVVAATNRIDTLDPALLRDGRFGKHVYIPLPNQEEREEIINVHLKKLPHYNIDSKLWSERTKGFSGAKLAGLVEGAAMEATRENAENINDMHVSASRDRIVVGLPQTRTVSSDVLNRVAYHELGHAVVSILLGSPVEKITIEPRGPALGITVIEGKDEMLLETETDIRKDLAMMMGGRAAESIFSGDISGGASNDMERASKRARHAVKIMGLGGMAPYIPEHTTLDVNIEKYARAWVFDSYETATQILHAFEPTIHMLKETLIKEISLPGFVIQEALNKAHPDEVKNKDWLIKTFSKKIEVDETL